MAMGAAVAQRRWRPFHLLAGSARLDAHAAGRKGRNPPRPPRRRCAGDAPANRRLPTTRAGSGLVGRAEDYAPSHLRRYRGGECLS